MTTTDWKTVCPVCGYKAECHTDVDSDVPIPHPGAVALCIECGAFNLFDDNLDLRAPTELEAEEFSRSEQLARVHAAWVIVDARRKAGLL